MKKFKKKYEKNYEKNYERNIETKLTGDGCAFVNNSSASSSSAHFGQQESSGKTTDWQWETEGHSNRLQRIEPTFVSSEPE